MVNNLSDLVNLTNLRFKIGELSKMAGVSTRQLRYWEQKKFISANEREADQDARVFSFRMYIKVLLIKHYLDEGYKLAAANEKSKDVIEDELWLHRFFEDSFKGIELIDGKRAVNLGFFDQENRQTLYGFNEGGKISYAVKPLPEKEEEL